jgi:hypothetical protein
MKRGSVWTAVIAAGWVLLVGPRPAAPFCGFYVASGDARIYNRSSKVVLARDGDRTVLTMASDYMGNPRQFALVVPVPQIPRREQVHVGDSTWVTHLDHYSVPRLVEYHDPNPCPRQSSTKQIVTSEDLRSFGALKMSASTTRIVASYKVDEYEIVILSASEAKGLAAWLRSHGYRIPESALPVVKSYIRQGLFFFVAKIDLAEQARRGFGYIRPLQVAFESPRFMLPIRLGMANAQGPQEMFVFTLTRRGRVEATNYRTARVPTDVNIPEFVRGDFPSFYRRVFDQQHASARPAAVFLEYVWVIVPSTPSCDPCTGPAITPEEARSLGAYWVKLPPSPPGDFVLTRLHLRYDKDHFPEDLQFQETGDRQNWQARYVIHHPYRGGDECPELAGYRQSVWERRKEEALNYCDLTGADLEQTRARMGVGENWREPDEAVTWWERIWPK